MLKNILSICKYLVKQEPLYNKDYNRIIEFVQSRKFEETKEILVSIVRKEHLKEKKDRIHEYSEIIALLTLVEEYLSKLDIDN